MKKLLLFFVSMLMSMMANAYDFAVPTLGVTIYYNYINDSTELEVTYGNNYSMTTDAFIPGEVTYMNRALKVASIGDNAFRGCSRTNTIKIPNSVRKIGNHAFDGCSHAAFSIPDSITSIGISAFEDCDGLTSFSIPNSVTSIGNDAFYSCSNLTSVDIPNNLTSIEKNVFYGCSSLTSIVIPNSVISIGEKAFYYCSKLDSVSIGSGVASIDRNAFDKSEISVITSKIENPFPICGKTSDERVFTQNTYNNATLYVPKGCIERYKATDGWKDFVFIEESDTLPSHETCEKPTISYVNGNLTFTSATEGATCYYSITDTDIKAGSGNEVKLTATYNISVYAAKEGFENSETTTATLCWIDTAPQTEGITDGMAQITTRPVLVKTDNGFITVEGIDDKTDVSVYTADGKQVGTAVSRNGKATISTNIKSGSIAIVKLGDKSVKVLMK